MSLQNQLVIFDFANGQVQVRLEGETVWLSQAQMAELFGTSSDNISLHLKNIYKEQELQEAATTEDFSVVRQEGKRKVTRQVKHYNLDAIIVILDCFNLLQTIKNDFQTVVKIVTVGTEIHIYV